MGDRFCGTFPTLIWKSIHSPSCVDHVSKWVEAIACPRNDANTVARFIQRNILIRFGAPRTIIGDKVSHFANKLFAKLMSRYGIKHIMGLSYHPQSNRQEEISNKEIRTYWKR